MTKIAVDLFSGTGSATKAFRESNDWKVFAVELNPNNDFDSDRIDLEKDIMDVNPEELPNKVDFVWASPPCTDFSVACMSDKWTKKGLPKVDTVPNSVAIVYKTLYLIREMNPDYWFMENPRGKMRKVTPDSLSEIRYTITYCQYGDDRMKPTDLWGVHPSSFKYRKCKNNAACHQSSPRGSQKGTQMLSGNKKRSMIPYGLSKEIFDAVENPGKYKKQQSLMEV